MSKRVAKSSDAVWRYDNGRYIGEHKDGMRHGNGKFTYKNKDWYEGDFKLDMMHGQGVYQF
ncbi:MAG TPA: hypothetical protein QF671_05455, partial [Candidatus Thalassarchaeaceae archaeon]|nr:hypothetical protein [Candidatus Thalassarchaeaceae archaeon]